MDIQQEEQNIEELKATLSEVDNLREVLEAHGLDYDKMVKNNSMIKGFLEVKKNG